MALQPILVDGEWRKPKHVVDTFQATNPSAKEPLPEVYPVPDFSDVEQALQAAHKAVAELQGLSPDKLAEFLENYAGQIEARADDLIDMADLETALGKEPRLRTVELPRTTNQLRQAAAAARDRSWAMATIDTGSNIRSIYGPLGAPVAVFGPNNFPFAFNSAAGGDFAAAIAAGNPVIAKANTGHPGTTKIFAEAAMAAVSETGLPRAMVQLFYRLKPADGLKFVSHPLIGATGFTGSKWAGLKLKEAADKVGKPIYLEMSSVNPVFILPGVLQERLAEVANELYGSCALGAGQFCTNPGLTVLLQNETGEAFVKAAGQAFEQNNPQTLLSARGPADIADTLETLKAHGAEVVAGGEVAEGPGYAFKNTVLRVSGDAFVENSDALQTEAFGTVTLLVLAKDVTQMQAVASHLEGQLTGCLYSHSTGGDDEIYDQVAPILRTKVGRLLNDKMPTGVAVVSAMNHGGPYPATGHPGFTAVGIPASLLRFGALHCYDNVRAHRLPAELQDKNPTGSMWRSIDGEWTQRDVA